MTLTNSRGAQKKPKITTSRIISEVAQHTGQPKAVVSDVVYATLHYVKYATYATGNRASLRKFGSFYQTTEKGRMYGKQTSNPTYRPDRIKLGIKTELIEVDKWKSTQFLQKQVASALSAALKPESMDLSVCARVAGLVLSSRPIEAMETKQLVEFVREWIYAIGAAPLLPSITYDEELSGGVKSHALKYRLKGGDRQAVVLSAIPNPIMASMAVKGDRDVLFTKTGWISGIRVDTSKSELGLYGYGTNSEDLCLALFKAYQAAKYGEKKPRPEEQEDDL